MGHEAVIERQKSNQFYEVEPVIASRAIDPSEFPKLFTNTGAVGVVTLTAPQEDVRGGEKVVLAATVAQAFRFQPGAAGAVYVNDAKQTDNKYVEINTVGESLTLVHDGNGDWFVTALEGSATIEA